MGGGTDTITRDTVSRCLSRDGGINGGTLSRSLSRWDHYVTECQIHTSHLHTGAEKQRARNQSTIATKSQKINKASSARDCFRFGCFFQSLENVSPVDPGVPHYPCCLVANAVLYLTNCLPGRAGDLAPIKLVSTLHFNLYPRGLQSLLRQPTLSGWDQEAIGARVTLTPL